MKEFSAFLVLWIIFFIVIYLLTGVDYDDGDYPEVSALMVNVL